MTQKRGEGLLTEVEAAKRLSCAPRTLQGWRTKGTGPRFVLVTARCVRYRIEDLDEFIESRVRTSTSDDGSWSSNRQ